jgi:hypothetical protein
VNKRRGEDYSSGHFRTGSGSISIGTAADGNALKVVTNVRL